MLSDQSQGQLSANFSGQYFSLAGEGGSRRGIMKNDFIIHVYDRNYLLSFLDCMHYITKRVK